MARRSARRRWGDIGGLKYLHLSCVFGERWCGPARPLPCLRQGAADRSAHSAGPNWGGGPWRMLGVPWGSLRVRGGSLEVAGGVLWLCWVPAEVLGRSSGGLWGVLGVPGGSLGVPGGVPGTLRRVLGRGPWRLRKHIKFSEGVWGGSRGTPGMILVVWGGPRDRPGRWEC